MQLDPADALRSPLKKILNLLQQWRGFILFVVVMLVFRSAVADWNHVPSGSMVPSILIGDRIVVDKMAYSLRVPFTLRPIAEFAPPGRGDVVTFVSPASGQLLVKRVIGIPGDRVQMRGNLLSINDQPASYRAHQAADNANPATTADDTVWTSNGFTLELFDEHLGSAKHTIALAKRMRPNAHQSFAAVNIPADHFLMLGDNRDLSDDYRKIGLIHRRQIVGRAHAVAFSLDLDAYRVRADRFFKRLN